MRRRRRADQPRGVGAGGGHRQQHGLQQGARQRVRRHPHRDGVETGGRHGRDRRAGRPRQDQGQRPGPAGLGQRHRAAIKHGDGAGAGKVGHVHDQGVVRRPALGAVDAGHRRVVGRDRAQPVDGLGRERHEATPAQGRGRRLDRGCGRGEDPAQSARRRRSRLRPASARAVTRASLSRSPSRNGSTPTVNALRPADERGQPGDADGVVDDDRGQHAQRDRQPMARALRGPARDRRRRQPAQDVAARGPHDVGQADAALGRAGEHRQADRPLGDVEQHGRDREARPVGDAQQEHDGGLHGDRHRDRTAPGSWPRPTAAGCRRRASDHGAQGLAVARGRGPEPVGEGGHRGGGEHGVSRHGEGRRLAPDHTGEPAASKPRCRSSRSGVVIGRSCADMVGATRREGRAWATRRSRSKG